MYSTTRDAARARVRSWLAGLLAFTAFASLLVWFLPQADQAYADGVRSTATTDGARMASDLTRAIERRVSITQELVGYAVGTVSTGALTQEGFEEFATRLDAASNIELRSLQLAPDGVVTFVYPLAGNEEALGYDVLADPTAGAQVRAAIDHRATMVVGPLELRQGGTGIVARSPVTTGLNREFWGVATVVADWEPLLADAGFDRLPEGFEVAVRGQQDEDGIAAPVFGDQRVFHGEPVLFEVSLPSGSWELGVVPTGGWEGLTTPGRGRLIAWTLGIALALGGLTDRMVAASSRARRAGRDREDLIDTLSTPVLELLADDRISLANTAAARLFDLDPLLLPRMRLSGDDCPDALAPLAALVAAHRGGEVVRRRETVLSLPAGEGRWLVDITERRSPRGVLVLSAQDITDRLEIESVRADLEATSRTARMKDEFVAGMSHELRTPLNGIIGLSTMLQKPAFGELTEKQRLYVQRINDSGRHLLSLINDVLDLAKIDAGHEELRLAPVDVSASVLSAVNIVHELADDAGLELQVALTEDLGTIQADERRIIQILVNLLSNAIKFTPHGAVGVDGLATETDVLLTVWDTGVGIPREKLHLLFQSFQQLDSDLDRNHEGTGLGLALSQRMAGLHGGEITVQSEPGTGSRFTVRIPRGSVTIVDQGDQDDEVTHTIVLPRTREDGAPVRVLLAEDNDVNRLLVGEYLRHQGYEVTEAHTGSQVLPAVRHEPPDVILLDVQMPERDGLSIARELKTDPALRHIPVIALTALAMAGDEDRCLAAGCDAYMSKPVDPDALAAQLQALLSPEHAP